MWGRHPIFGAGSSWLTEWQDRTYRPEIYNIFHNGYLEVAVRYGIVGLAFYAFLFAWAARQVLQAARAGLIVRSAWRCYHLDPRLLRSDDPQQLEQPTGNRQILHVVCGSLRILLLLSASAGQSCYAQNLFLGFSETSVRKPVASALLRMLSPYSAATDFFRSAAKSAIATPPIIPIVAITSRPVKGSPMKITPPTAAMEGTVS